jgi:hypothetical protein
VDYFGVAFGPSVGPQAYKCVFDPGYVTNPHFHRVPQFQVVTRGTAVLAKRAYAPVSVHYADAFTPYGPIRCSQSMVRFALRSSSDSGAHWMPAERKQMEQKAGRGLIVETRLKLGDPVTSVKVETLLGPYDDGLYAMEIVAPAGAQLTDKPASGSGRYQLVLAGSMQLTDQELSADSLIFESIGDAVAPRRAGPAGLHLLELQLPER